MTKAGSPGYTQVLPFDVWVFQIGIPREKPDSTFSENRRFLKISMIYFVELWKVKLVYLQ